VKWRCPQCGKPHERNDPPCDNCGHHKFERAVVPQAKAEDDYEQFVWACTACGRHHQRNNPPCSRCGNGTFEKKPLEYEDFEGDSTTTYRELVGRQEIALVGVIVALLVVGVVGFLGIVDIPGITPAGPPTVEDVPGDSERSGSVALADIESALLESIDAQRDGQQLQRSDGLDSTATFSVRFLAKGLLAGEQRPISGEDLQRFDTPCNGLPSLAFGQSGTTTGESADAEAVAAAISPAPFEGDPAPTAASVSRIGVGSHAAPDGTVFVVLAYC